VLSSKSKQEFLKVKIMSIVKHANVRDLVVLVQNQQFLYGMSHALYKANKREVETWHVLSVLFGIILHVSFEHFPFRTDRFSYVFERAISGTYLFRDVLFDISL
jgi:hypothetical protein